MEGQAPLSIPENVAGMLPHRFPFLLFDRVISPDSELKKGQVRALKNICYSDPLVRNGVVPGSFFPSILILEAMAQAAGTLVTHYPPLMNRGLFFYFAALGHVRFYDAVEVGDQLCLNIRLLRYRSNMVWFAGEASINDRIICMARFTCAGEISSSGRPCE
ncbi:3-hydroxyacyl-ACP dehydratase FabZ family protein [Pantoea sp. At-9b]|jgi:3-hydroxyacyl-[acyl-carrier-protein] dehydratase|uniref:3-hydroxyacyl-ACP dehydratase FabZ family protein n=1 Tax=Pantoea sp. (strain At-9b) TaxID=592316 RepID=UPI0001F26037|nr:3-hydroxyacyl-ACP dehydratase FabZ family protein [Pantoea sp. At-9b]ADU72131.1 Beta-hydroxyacyl-(acyl-carrier-protein) dehydratase FabA/FabZ [Pantoea sp. At-9b]